MNLGLVVTTALAAGVECVEALTIVLAVGAVRGWRSTFWGVGLGAGALVAATVAGALALDGVSVAERWVHLAVGLAMLAFGAHWLRKAILRATGRKQLRDEAAAFRRGQDAARAAGGAGRLDRYALTVAFQGIVIEGLEVVFIVVSFGRNAHDVPLAAVGAVLAAVVVTAAGVALRHPLTRVPENAMKLAVGLLLTAFGTFWTVEGLGARWPGDELSALGLLALFGAGTAVAIRPRGRGTRR